MVFFLRMYLVRFWKNSVPKSYEKKICLRKDHGSIGENHPKWILRLAFDTFRFKISPKLLAIFHFGDFGKLVEIFEKLIEIKAKISVTTIQKCSNEGLNFASRSIEISLKLPKKSTKKFWK